MLTADADITTAAQRSDIHAIVLEQNGSMQIGKSVDRRLDPLDDTQVYSVEYANFASAFPLDPPTMIDVLPWNGDGLGGVNERTPESDFEGTVVLERLAEIGRLEDFFDAVDADDIPRAVGLLKRAHLDAATIALVVQKMEDPDGDH